jgi:hypothetical protein
MGFNRVRGAVAAVALSAVTVLGVGGASASAATVGHAMSGVSYASHAKRVQYSHVRVNGLRFRTRASSRGTVRGLLYRGDRVQIIGSAVGPWIHVRLAARSRGGSHKGATGWVAKRYLYGPSCHNYHTWPCSAWR